MSWQRRYRKIEELEPGGFGNVIRVEDTESGEVVVLKELKPKLVPDDEVFSRFLREIEIMRQFDHPHVVPILDFDARANPPYYVMPSYDSSLRAAVRSGAVNSLNIPGLMSPILDGLEYLHEKQIAHRDLHPGNILLRDGIASIADFSIAKRLDLDSFHTFSSLGGFPGYAAPEQSGRSRIIDRRADIYAVGGLLGLLVTGIEPLHISDSSKLGRYRAVYDRCRQYEASSRFRDVAEIRNALEAIWNVDKSWARRERIRNGEIADADVGSPEQLMDDLLYSCDHNWIDVVDLINELSEYQSQRLFTSVRVLLLVSSLRERALERSTPFSYLDPLGSFLNKVVLGDVSIETKIECIRATLEIGAQFDQYSYRRLYLRLSRALMRLHPEAEPDLTLLRQQLFYEVEWANQRN